MRLFEEKLMLEQMAKKGIKRIYWLKKIKICTFKIILLKYRNIKNWFQIQEQKKQKFKKLKYKTNFEIDLNLR